MGRITAAIARVARGVPGVSGAGTYDVRETETRSYAAPPALSVHGRNGAVTVHGEDRDDVSVTVEKRARSRRELDGTDVVATGGGGEQLDLSVERERRRSDARVSITVAVPSDVRIDRLETKNGSVEVTDAVGDAVLETSNGSITAEGVDGYLTLRTNNGSVTARDVAGIDEAATSNGAIEVELDAVRQDVSIASTTGEVSIAAGPSLDADVFLSTSVGSVDAPALGASTRGVVGSEVSGTLGDGGPHVRVENSVGAVELVRTE